MMEKKQRILDKEKIVKDEDDHLIKDEFNKLKFLIEPEMAEILHDPKFKFNCGRFFAYFVPDISSMPFKNNSDKDVFKPENEDKFH